MNRRIFRPCSECIHEHDCQMFRGCWKWRTYFRAYWGELRKKYRGAKYEA